MCESVFMLYYIVFYDMIQRPYIVESYIIYLHFFLSFAFPFIRIPLL